MGNYDNLSDQEFDELYNSVQQKFLNLQQQVSSGLDELEPGRLPVDALKKGFYTDVAKGIGDIPNLPSEIVEVVGNLGNKGLAWAMGEESPAWRTMPKTNALKNYLLGGVEQIFPGEPQSDLAKASYNVGGGIGKAASMVGTGLPLKAVQGIGKIPTAARAVGEFLAFRPKLQMAGGAAEGIIDAALQDPNSTFGEVANLATVLSPDVVNLAKAATGGIKNFLVGPSAKEMASTPIKALFPESGPAPVTMEDALATIEQLKQSENLANPAYQRMINANVEKAGFQEPAGQWGNLLQTTLKEKAAGLGDVSQRLGQELFSVTEPTTPAVRKAMDVINPELAASRDVTYWANPFTEQAARYEKYPTVGGAMQTTAEGRAMLDKGITKGGQVGEAIDRIDNIIDKTASVATKKKIVARRNAAENYMSYANDPDIKPFLEEAKLAGKDMELALVRDANSNSSIMTRIEQSPRVRQLKQTAEQLALDGTLGVNNKITEWKSWVKMLESKAAVLKRTWGEDKYKLVLDAAKKGNDSLLGVAIESNLGMSANLATGAIIGSALATGLGIISPIAGTISAGTTLAAVKYFRALKNKPNVALALLKDAIADPSLKKLKDLKNYPTPQRLTDAKKAIVKAAAIASRYGLLKGAESKTSPEEVAAQEPLVNLENLGTKISDTIVPKAEAEELPVTLSPEVKLNKSLNSKIEAAADEAGVPAEIAKTLVHIESRGNPKAISKAGAGGIMQIMPATFKETAAKMGLKKADRFNVDDSLKVGLRYLKDQYDRFGDWSLAAAAYNAGPGAVSKWIRIHKTRDWEKLKKLIAGYKETKDYVKEAKRLTDNFSTYA